MNGARKEASDFLNARIKQKCPSPPKIPKIENVSKSFIAIGSKNGIRIMGESKNKVLLKKCINIISKAIK